MAYPNTDEAIEASRHERLKELRASRRVIGPDDHDREQPAQAALSLMQAIDDQLAGHPAIVSDPELYRLAYRAFANLFQLHRVLAGQASAAPPEPKGLK